MTLFELIAKLVLDTSGFDEKAGKAKETGEGLAGQLTNVTAKAVAMGNAMWDMADRASRAMWNFAGDLVQTAADVQAEQAQFASVFAESAGDANSIFSRLSEENNIYISRLRQQGSSMYAQFKTGGAESAEALDMMGRAMQVAADAAAFYDVSLEDASYRLRSFLRGNVEAGEAIGLFTSSVAREAKAAELFDSAWKELNEVQRETALLSIAEDAYANANATGQASMEAENYTNVLGNLQARWREVKATLGAPILSAITPVIEELGDFLENKPELVEKFAEGIGAAAEALSNAAIYLIEYIGEHSDEIVAFIDRIYGLFGALPKDMTVEKSYKGGNEYDHVWEYDYRAMAQTMRASPYEYGITEAMAEEWLETLMRRGPGDDVYDQALRDIVDAYNSAEDENDKSSDEDSEALIGAVNDLRTTLDNLPGMLSAALSGVSVGIDGGPLLGYISTGLSRSARQSVNTSTASA